MSHSSDHEFLSKHRIVWQNKTVLRRLYHEQYYQRLFSQLAEGTNNFEIGSGPGFLEEFDNKIIRSDILLSPHIHVQVDAHHLPFEESSLDNLIGLDVLHHFNKPIAVLREAGRALRKGGRIILIEPYITPFSRLIYTYLHQEECDLSAQPWIEQDSLFHKQKNAFDGNAAIPFLLLEKGRGATEAALPSLKLIKREKFSLITYLLSGGFKPMNLLPNPLYGMIYRFEQFSEPLWRDLAALRALIVWEKQ